MFLMFRKFFLCHVEKYDDIDSGIFIVKWTTDDDFVNMIKEICLVFKLMYKINYKLWKITDLQIKRKTKNKSD